LEYVKLGSTGLDVSRIVLGCMSYGVPERGTHPWTMPEAESREFLKKALDLGINFLDTANQYSDGTSEEIVGRAVRDFARRDEVVIATKVYFRMRPGPNGGGLSRKAIMTEVDNSLRRLGTDYIDLYQIHRWDYTVPIEETLEALHDLVRSGKVLHIGASSMWAWQFTQALYTADLNGWTRFATMQNHYNLLNREEEREMLPFCADQGIGVIPWSPLARGKLTRDWGEGSEREDTDEVLKALYRSTEQSDRAIVDAVGQIAAERAVPRAQVALAWVASRPWVTAPIVGATKQHQLDDAVAALEIELSDDEVDRLEAPYVPHPVEGHQ
jgi:aryl-alcohol dehydrogenase (NADP+)